jgi:hypothetical protein
VAGALLNFLFCKSTTIGEAIKIDEYVPITIPTKSEKENPLRTSPPKSNSTVITNNVVREVIIVRLKVLLIAVFTVFSMSEEVFNPKVSLILSNTITVSLILYPITVRMAAIKT